MSFREAMSREPSKPLRARLRRTGQYQWYCEIVDRIEGLACARLGEPLRIDEICVFSGVSQRTLRTAVRAVHEMTPCRFVRAIRMREARKAMLSQLSATETITQIAMRFGFLELGRFSVEYRLMFGECPSATRRRVADTLRQYGLGPADIVRPTATCRGVQVRAGGLS
jgi:AraC-like DNA-binding protein